MVAIDHRALGLSRVAAQYQNSPKFLAYLAALLALSNEVEATLSSLALLPDIDAMTGVNLDTIGIIVGVSRNVGNIVELTFFGFADTGYYATCFGEEGHPNIGSRFYEEGEPYLGSSVLGDPEYRMLIRSQIVKNSSHATGEDILAALSYLFPDAPIAVTDNYDMTFSLAVGRALTSIEKAIIAQLDLLPRPSSVALTSISTPAGVVPINTQSNVTE
jgi:hypothetical protein